MNVARRLQPARASAIRTRHYSRRTEVAYVTWIRRYLGFHRKAHPATLGAPDILAFLTWLATSQQVSASTQNQALAALLFLCERVLQMPVGQVEHVVRAKQPIRLPVVLSRDEVVAVLSHLDGTMWVIGMLLYGSGLQLQECVELRVKDIDFDRNQVTVRRGKGQKNRTTALPAVVTRPLGKHLAEVRRLHLLSVHADDIRQFCDGRTTPVRGASQRDRAGTRLPNALHQTAAGASMPGCW